MTVSSLSHGILILKLLFTCGEVVSGRGPRKFHYLPAFPHLGEVIKSLI